MLLKRKQIPVYTALSMITSVVVEVEIMSSSLPAADSKYPVPEAVGSLLFKALALMTGVVILAVAGRFAYKRRELWGARIAALGAAVWLVTLAALSPFSR